MRVELNDCGQGFVWKNKQAKFDCGLSYEQFFVRRFGDLKSVWYQKDSQINSQKPVYFMYRGISGLDGEEKISPAVRFDLTIIPGFLAGEEYTKTFGHYHPVDYPEIYEVRTGEAWYLLQKHQKHRPDKIEKIILVKVKAAEKIIIPPHFGHVTVNALPKTLVMTNYVADCFSSNYELFKKYRGGGYFILKDGIIKNSHYKFVAEIEKMSVEQEVVKNFLAKYSDLNFLFKPKEVTWQKLKLFRPAK